MDRLKLWLIPVYALVGFVFVVVLMPKTSWILKVQKDVLAGSWTTQNGPMEDQGIGSPTPKQLGPSPEDKATDESTTFLKLMGACQQSANLSGPGSTAERDRRFRALFDFCRSKNSAEYWAQFVRADSMDARVHSIDDPVGLPEPFDRSATRKLLLKACDFGAVLDPQNSFFPVMEASALYVARDLKGASNLFKLASKETRFEDYMNLESNLQYEWFEKRNGYLGHQIRLYVLAAAVYPHFLPIKNLARRLIQTGHPEDRVAAMRLGGLMMNQSSSIIGIFVGRAIISSALLPEQRRGSYKEVPDEKVGPLTAQLQAAIPDSGDLARIAQDYTRLKPPYSQLDQDDTTELMSDSNLLDTAWPIVLVMLLPISILGLWSNAKFPQLRAISPYFVWLMCIAIGFVNANDASVPVLFTAVALLAIPAYFERSRRVADVVAMVLAVVAVGIAVGFGAYALFAPACLFMGLLALERFATRIPAWVTGLAFIVVLFVIGAVLINLQAYVGFERTWMACIGVVVAGLAIVPVRGDFRWQQLAGFASLIVLIVFGYSVSRSLMRDKALGKALAIWDREAVDIRESRGLH